jgi:hypothetical protein
VNWTKNVRRVFIILCVELNAKISELVDDLINGFDSANERWIDIITLNFDISRFNTHEEPVTNDNLKASAVTPRTSISGTLFIKIYIILWKIASAK